MLTQPYDTSVLWNAVTIAALLLMVGTALYALHSAHRTARRSSAIASLDLTPSSLEHDQHGVKHFDCQRPSRLHESSQASMYRTRETSSYGDDQLLRDTLVLSLAGGVMQEDEPSRPTHQVEVQDHSGTEAVSSFDGDTSASSITFE